MPNRPEGIRHRSDQRRRGHSELRLEQTSAGFQFTSLGWGSEQENLWYVIENGDLPVPAEFGLELTVGARSSATLWSLDGCSRSSRDIWTKRGMVSVPGNGEWTEGMVQKLRVELDRYPGALAVGDEAARNAGKLVGLNDIAQRARISKQQISNELSAMSKATRRLFGDKRWPFQAVDTSQGMHYLMQSEIAEWWETA